MTWATLPTDRILTVNANLEACDHASFLVVFSLSWRSHSHICPLDSTRTLVHPMVMDGFKCEHEPHNILEDPSLPQKYRAFRHNCTRPWTWKRDGSPHEMCTLHRHQAQYNVQRASAYYEFLLMRSSSRMETLLWNRLETSPVAHDWCCSGTSRHSFLAS
jgi:hypothetical protein